MATRVHIFQLSGIYFTHDKHRAVLHTKLVSDISATRIPLAVNLPIGSFGAHHA